VIQLDIDRGFPLRRDALFSKYDYLCRTASRRYRGEHFDGDDLIQIARVGLLKAIDRYDEAIGVPFAAYAWGSVIGELQHALRDQADLIRTPRTVRRRARALRQAQERLTHELGRPPFDFELRSALGAKSCSALIANPMLIESIDGLEVAQDDAGHEYDRIIDCLALRRCMRELSPLERGILQRIYCRDEDLCSVAAVLGYSTRQIARIKKKAIEKLARWYVIR